MLNRLSWHPSYAAYAVILQSDDDVIHKLDFFQSISSAIEGHRDLARQYGEPRYNRIMVQGPNVITPCNAFAGNCDRSMHPRHSRCKNYYVFHVLRATDFRPSGDAVLITSQRSSKHVA